MKRAVLLILAVLALVGVVLFMQRGSMAPVLVPLPVDTADSSAVRIGTGLSQEEAELWHHHDEGSGFLPLSFFQALIDIETGRPFLESLPRFGLVADPTNPYGVPVGLSVATVSSAPNDSLFIGVSCSGCHSGQYTYQGTRMTIDGAPNMLDFQRLLDGLSASLKATISSPPKLYQMVSTMIRLEHETVDKGLPIEWHPSAVALSNEVASADETHPLYPIQGHLQSVVHDAYHAESSDQTRDRLSKGAEEIPDVDASSHSAGHEALGHFREAISKLHDSLEYMKRHAKRLKMLTAAFEGSTDSGPGRADSFDAIWDLLVQHDQVMAMDAPVSIPHLFEYATFEWVHWDGNSSSVVGRDYAQAIALGGEFIAETLETSILPRNIIELEITAQSLKAPEWPTEILGAIDKGLVRKGKKIFSQHCYSCHSRETLVPVQEVGTDPHRADNFANLQQDGKSYAELLMQLGESIPQVSLETHGVSADEIAAITRSANPTWRVTNSYQSRPLSGLWASPPYLHNGSVPTVWNLLQPASERPSRFFVGRELDPKKLGIDIENQPESDWTFDISAPGNSNQGHDYGTDLSEEEKWSLIEFLKTQ